MLLVRKKEKKSLDAKKDQFIRNENDACSDKLA